MLLLHPVKLNQVHYNQTDNNELLDTVSYKIYDPKILIQFWV